MLKKIFIITAAIFIFISCEEETETVNEQKVPVKVFEVKQATISQYLRLTGSTEAENDAIVYAKINEKIEEVYVQVGDRVKSGDVIAEQYNEVLKQGVDLAKAALRTAESQNKLTEQNFERMKKLFEQKAISPQQYEQAETQYETGKAGLEQAKTQLQQAEENYQNSFIKAPFDGVVAAINFEENQMVMAGQPVSQVVNPNSMNAKLTVSGKEVNKIKIGQKAEIEFPSIPNKVYTGEVVRINEALNPLTNTLEFEVRITDSDEDLKSGIFGKFNLELIKRENVMVVPEVAVQQQTEVQINRETGVQQPIRTYFLFKIVDGKAQLTKVQIGIRDGGRIEVTDGISLDDQVVVVGQNIVKDGDQIKIIE